VYDRGVDHDAWVTAARPPLERVRLRLAVLFGSAARGSLRDDSDIDVGIVPSDPQITLNEELALQADLERAFGRRVDLVRLDRASVLLRWRAAREGVPLVAEPRHEWPRFVARAGIEHAELAPLYARAAEGFRRKLAAGGPAR
jgi:predicted nucleotidyltransferase